MKKKLPRFIISFFCFALVFSIILGAAAFAFDPQNMYRWNEKGVRIYNPRFSAAGSIMNYDYDTAIIGSSMVQTFNADTFAENFNCKPLKITLGGIFVKEILYVYDAAQKADKAKRYFVNVDLHKLAAQNRIYSSSGRFPKYMFNSGIFSQLQYLLGYETWFCFMPMDIALSASRLFWKHVPSSVKKSIAENTDINLMSKWDNSKIPGREKLIEDFRNNVKNFDEGEDSSHISDHAVENVEEFMNFLLEPLDDDEELIIYFPAYSILYWADKSDIQIETFFEMREFFVEIADRYPNVTVLDTQGIEEINDLDLYSDATHYGKTLCENIEKNLANGSYVATGESIKISSDFIKKSREKYTSS